MYGIIHITIKKALRKAGNLSDKIKYNWFVPTYILYSVSVFAQFVYTIFVIYSITLYFIVMRNGIKELRLEMLNQFHSKSL